MGTLEGMEESEADRLAGDTHRSHTAAVDCTCQWLLARLALGERRRKRPRKRCEGSLLDGQPHLPQACQCEQGTEVDAQQGTSGLGWVCYAPSVVLKRSESRSKRRMAYAKSQHRLCSSMYSLAARTQPARAVVHQRLVRKLRSTGSETSKMPLEKLVLNLSY